MRRRYRFRMPSTLTDANLDRISDDLVELTALLAKNGTDTSTGAGFLGGANGYGAEFGNDVFQMHMYFWDDCRCGWADALNAWERDEMHRPTCFASRTAALGYEDIPHASMEVIEAPLGDGVVSIETRRGPNWDAERAAEDAAQLAIRTKAAAEAGLATVPDFAFHCTCDGTDRLHAWREQHPHDPACETVRPLFLHRASGIEVRWYKYIGRGMEVAGLGSMRAWRSAMDECRSSVSDNGR